MSDSTSLAKALSELTNRSGLFYESHLAQWVEGSRSIETLREEPHFRWTELGQDDTSTTTRIVPDDLTPIVKQQLEMLERPAFTWRGEAWPGQPVQISVEPQQQEPRKNGEHADQPQEVWITRLKLNLPKLSSVDALVAVQGNRAAFTLTSSTASASPLSANSTDLQKELAARGIDVESFTVNSYANRAG